MIVQQGQKYRWVFQDTDSVAIADIAANNSLSLPVAEALWNRGFRTQEQITRYFFTSLENDVPHPMILEGVTVAADRIGRAITAGEKILICGDYDVDGITATSIAILGLLQLGANVNFFLPHRVKDGYGLSVKTVEKAAESGYSVIITVDNGITAFDAAARAKQLGIDLIITDHHRPHGLLPDAFSIINPNQDGCPYPYKMLAGVGVVFKLISFLFERAEKSLPQKMYELLLLGTIADVVPLTGENRYWVRFGLQNINNQASHALTILKQNGSLLEKPRIRALDIAFGIAPQINALGRLDDPRSGVRFLLDADTKEVLRVGQILFELNESRKSVERGITQSIVNLITHKSINLDENKAIIAKSQEWPPGVIGLVASRLVGLYSRPTILFHETKDGILKGSCRSIPHFNIFNFLETQSSILHSFGGHSQAAGLSLSIKRLPEFQKALEQACSEQLSSDDFIPSISIDGHAYLEDVTTLIIKDLEYMEPFGHQNEQPIFCFNNLLLLEPPTLLKTLHVKCRFVADGAVRSVIFFNRPDLYEVLLEKSDQHIAIVARITENWWNGRQSVELQGVDLRFL